MQSKSYIALIKTTFNQIFILVFFVVGFSSCVKGPDFPLSPVIEFYSIDKEEILDEFQQTLTDSVTISIKFQDGDGDLGVEVSDLGNVDYREFSDTSISDDGEESYTFINYYVDFFKKENGDFVPIETFIRFGGSFEPLVDYDEVGPINGILNFNFSLSSRSFSLLGFEENDTARFEVYIVDRALNVSNVITTDELVLFEKE